MLMVTWGYPCISLLLQWSLSGYLVFPGSLGFIGVTWIPMGSCSPEWADFVGGRWCGLGWLPHFWCGLWPAKVWERFPWGWWVHSVLGIVSRYQIQWSSSGLWLSFGLTHSEAARGLFRAPVGCGLHWGWVLPVTAWPACRLRWTALIGQLPVGVHGSHGFYVEPGSTPF